MKTEIFENFIILIFFEKFWTLNIFFIEILEISR